MSQVYLLCVDDEPEVLEAVERDLSALEDRFPLEIARDAAETRETLERIAADGDEVGAIFCDHAMPGETGVELLKWMNAQERWKPTRKALLTGQAGLEATVEAVNQAQLSHYVAKPWTRNGLLSVAKRLLTRYILDTKKDPTPYLRYLDPIELAEATRRGGLISDA